MPRPGDPARNATRLNYLERRVLDLETIINKKDLDHDQLVEHLAKVSQQLAECRARLYGYENVGV